MYQNKDLTDSMVHYQTSVISVKMFVNTLEKKLKTAFEMYGNPIEVHIIRKNQFRLLKSLKL